MAPELPLLASSFVESMVLESSEAYFLGLDHDVLQSCVSVALEEEAPELEWR